MKVLVTGKGGQLASEFHSKKNKDKNWIFCSVEDLDITDRDKVLKFFHKHSFEYVINCAAYTAVDDAENNENAAYSVNVLGPRNLALACKIRDSKLIHFSTDYVFDGQSEIPYLEYDKTNPKSVYGLTKLQGEKEIIKSCVKSIIIRTSWVYSIYGHNFVKTMLKLAKIKSELGIIYDQVGSPTNAEDLADAVLNIIETSKYVWINTQIFNFSNKGKCSWYEFALEIFKIKKINMIVKKLQTKDYKTLANRPKFSLLDKTKFENTFNYQIEEWQKSLKKMLIKI